MLSLGDLSILFRLTFGFRGMIVVGGVLFRDGYHLHEVQAGKKFTLQEKILKKAVEHLLL